MTMAHPQTETPDVRDGRRFMHAMEYSLRWLEINAEAIDRLNVYPVPDGDTGTNMVLTLRAAIREATENPSSNVDAVAASLARGALLGARGNSGVILSQIIRGLSEGLAGHREFGIAEFSTALERAYQVGYKAVTNPVEGTILTVARDAGEAAQAAQSQVASVEELIAQVVDATRESVANTPNLLDVLAEAGVVDAGGQGLHVIYEGLLRAMRGEPLPETADLDRATDVFAAFAETHQTDEHGFCTEFVVHGTELDADAMRTEFAKIGESLLVVGDASLVRVHVHTEQPGDAINTAMSFGELDQLKADNMNLQQARNFEGALAEASDPPPPANGVIAVASGDGLEEVFRSLGADVVRGGQSMNPSAGELLEAIERTPDDWAVVLPNNSNIYLTARQAAEQSKKNVHVIATRTLPQGFAAALAFNPADAAADNAAAMSEAAGDVTTLEVTQAVRDAMLDGNPVAKGEYMGLLDDKFVERGETPHPVILRMLDRLADDEPEALTIYVGQATPAALAEELTAEIGERYPDIDLQTVAGGQDHYDYIIAVE